MVSGVFGLTGAGKTSFLARCAYRAQKGKKLKIGFVHSGGCWLQDRDSRDYTHVFSSFPLEGCYKLDFTKLGEIQIQNSLLLIDEISLLCDSRNFRQFPENIKYFFTHHRHFGDDIIWCGQGWADTDLRIRNLTGNFLYITHSGFGFSRVCPINHAMTVEGGDIVDTYTLSAPLGRLYFRRKRYYSMFDSYETKPLPLEEFEKWDLTAV